jgi:hypothetical protein
MPLGGRSWHGGDSNRWLHMKSLVAVDYFLSFPFIRSSEPAPAAKTAQAKSGPETSRQQRL